MTLVQMSVDCDLCFTNDMIQNVSSMYFAGNTPSVVGFSVEVDGKYWSCSRRTLGQS